MKSNTKRILALVMLMCMVFSVITACGNKPAGPASSSPASSSPAATTSESASTAPEAFKPDYSKEVTLKWMYEGSTVTDDKAVMDAINAYLKPLINAKLQMVWCGWGDFDDRVRLSISGGDQMDIYFTCSWTANEYSATARQGAYVRLDNPEDNLLEKYAPTLFESLDPVLADAATTDGADGVGIYGIPTYKEIAQQYTWDVNLDMLAKYGFTEADVQKGYYEWAPMLEKIKAGEGKDFYPLNPEPAVMERFVNSNDTVDTQLLLAYYFDPADPTKSGTKLVSRYETPEYKKYVEKTREYYQAGYIDPQMANAQTAANARTTAQDAAKYAIGTQVYSPGYEFTTGPARKINLKYVPAQSGIISTTSARGAMHAISVTSVDPGRALALLNLVNTDPKLFTMLEYGIEGSHYTLTADGRVTLNQDMRKTYAPWRNGMGKLSNLPVLAEEPADMWAQFDTFNAMGKAVPVLGFAFNEEGVKNEMAALNNIRVEFADALNAGSVDPAEKLPEFISKLKANGIDTVLAEAQKQLDAFMAGKK